MPTEIKVPTLPESIADAVVVSWYKQPGDAVKRDETLLDVETDKVVLEVPAPADGVLKEIKENDGATVVAGQVLGIMDAGQVEAATPAATAKKTKGTEEKMIAADVVVTPSAKKMIEQHGLDVSAITPSGKGGRILKEDVISFIDELSTKPAVAETAKPQTKTTAVTEVGAVMPEGERVERRVPMTRLRARIAERLLEAQHNAAILTTFNEVNMQPVMALRNRYRDQFEKQFGVKLGFMSFFIKACIEALKRFPSVNASIDGNDMVYHGYFDIGVAVSSPRGLVVPVLRDADQLSLADIEGTIREFGEKAKNNALSMEDITGGTFTISNGGVFGSLLSTPILNPPQSGILGMHKIQERAMVENGDIVARPMMYLALSYDHRIIDGREAVQFLVTIKDMLEDPSRMIIGV